MSNSQNLNRMTWAINTLWDLENRTLDLGMGDALLQVKNVLKQVKDEMIIEREKRLKKDREDSKEIMNYFEKWVREQSWIRKPEGGLALAENSQ